MAFHDYDKKYQMDKKKAETALQGILAANGQEDAAGRSHLAFHKKGGRRWILWTLATLAAAALALAGIALWQH